MKLERIEKRGINMSEIVTSRHENRINQLSLFMEKYLNSEDKVALYHQYEKLLKEVEPLDLFYLPFFSENSILSNAEIKRYANRFVNLFYHGLASFQWNQNASQMLRKLIEENQAIIRKLESIKPFLENDKIKDSVPVILDLLKEMAMVERKFEKSQMILYPMLEKILPSKKPFQILWEVADDLLSERINLINLLKAEDINWVDVKKAIGQFYYQLAGLIQKEELIVLPLASEYLTSYDWDNMIISANEIGYAFTNSIKINQSLYQNNPKTNLLITTASGSLSLEQFSLVMSHLPMAITYVDEDDKVVYYNQTKERHFPRTPQAIGREVKNCHPEKSVHIVEKIISEFRNNKKDQAQFWMDFRGMKLLISYYAIRNSIGEYKGVLEVTQNISDMNEYQGEKKLLDWD